MDNVHENDGKDFNFLWDSQSEISLPSDFLAKLDVALASVVTYESCYQIEFVLVDGKHQQVIASVCVNDLEGKPKGDLAHCGISQEIPLNLLVAGKIAVLKLTGLKEGLDREKMKRIQRLFKNIESNLLQQNNPTHQNVNQQIPPPESEAKYKNLLENMLHAVVYHDKSGKITYANPASEKILGMTHDQIFGKTSMDPGWRAIHENGKTFYGKDHPVMEVLRTGNPVKNVVMGIQPGKSKRITWILINAIPELVENSNEIAQVLVTFSDITQVKAIERKIEEKAAVLRSIIESSTESIWAINTQLKLRYANTKFVKFCQNSTGKTISIGDSILDYVQEDKRDFWRENYQKVFEGEFLEINDSYQTKTGVANYRVNINPVFSGGKIIGASVFAMNVTELEQSMQTIRKQNERFREISWLQSHVIRAPLARLMGLLDLLLEHSDWSQLDQSSLFEKMKKASHEIDKVIREISHKSEDLI